MYNKIILAEDTQVYKIVPIRGYEGKYSITNDGRVWSHEKGNHKGKWLKPYLVRGYKTVDIGVRRKERITARVHRLVAEAFISQIEAKTIINHIDGNPLNNNENNLEWCDYTDNLNHACKIGLRKSCAGVPKRFNSSHIEFLRDKQIQKNKSRRKISIDDASEICEAYATGIFSCRELSLPFGVSTKTINNLVRGVSYVA